jgi:HlyD family secretion protein
MQNFAATFACFFVEGVGRGIYNKWRRIKDMQSGSGDNRRGVVLRRISFPIAALAVAAGGMIWVSRLKSAVPVVDRTAIQVTTVQRGPLVRKVEGMGVLVPEQVRSLTASTDGRVDQVLLRAGTRVQPDTVIVQLSNPDLERQLVDAELATKKVEAELANLRVQLQSQLLNEHAVEAQLESDSTESRLQAERDEALLKMQVGAAMNAKISRARADALATRLKIEKEKLAIAEESRQSQLTAKQAEVAQVQALYALKTQEKEDLIVRAGVAGVLEEISVDVGQRVGPGTNLARVSGAARLMARIHVPESASHDLQLDQKARLEIRDKQYAGHVSRIDPGVENGSVNVDLKMDGAQPAGAKTDLAVDGTIEVEKLRDAVYVQKPLPARPNSRVALFKLSGDGSEAERVMVDVGAISTDSVEIVDGLQAGDRVIVSDMSTWNKYDHVLVK